jgi:hypothetical protein
VIDPLERLEHELASLRPAPLSAKVVDAIADDLSAPSTVRFADRCLLAVMGAGSLAACVIVGLVGWQLIASEWRGAPASPSVLAVQSPVHPSAPPATLRQYQQALARSSDAAPELFR